MSSSVYAATVLLLIAVSVTSCSAALRIRGEPYVGIQNLDTQRPSKSVRYAKDTRIIGGEVAGLAEAPWHVSIQNQYGNHFCGGAIIADQWVLTAANCVAGLQPRNVIVITGTNNWMGEAIYYEVTNIILHCNFDRPMYHNDVALLKLKTLVLYNEKTQNITLANLDELEDGELLSFTGWGSWQEGGLYPEDLKKMSVKYLATEQCAKAYGNSKDLDEVGHLCTQTADKTGTCHGDSGGPLVNSKGELVGVSNWGVPCARGFPDVFAKVYIYNDWIRTTINGCRWSL